MSSAVATPLPCRARLRLVRDGDQLPGTFRVSLDKLSHGYQPTISGVPHETQRRKCKSRGRATAASRWLRMLAMAFQMRAPLPMDSLRPTWWAPSARRSGKLAVLGSPYGQFARTHNRPWRSRPIVDFGSKPLTIGRRGLSDDERKDMRRTLTGLERSGVETDPPATWGECQERDLPWCPYVSCKYHLYLDVDAKGSVWINFPGKEPWELEETCALRAIEKNQSGMTYEEAGKLVNLGRPAVFEIENRSLRGLRKRGDIDPE